MRVALIFCAVIAVTLAATVPDTPFASQKYVKEAPHEPTPNLFRSTFVTRQDHTRPQNQEVFVFEYFANLDFYVEGSPFYIYIRDAGEFGTRWIEEGLMVDIARETNGALFTYEQRYFGNNRVTPTASFEDMKFLTIEQILSDMATFIGAIRAEHAGNNNRIIVWGTGYGGSAAAFARKRYPHLIDAAWSTSGIFEIEPFILSQLDLLYDILLVSGDEVCRSRIQNAFEVLDYLIQNHNGEYIQERLNLCHPVDTNSSTDIAALYESNFDAIVEYIGYHHLNGINQLCADMNFYPEDTLNSFARWKLFVFGEDLQCFDHSYATIIENNSPIEFGTYGTYTGRRQWYHLQCTQLGLFSISHDLSWLPNRLDILYHFTRCSDVLGPNYMPILLQPGVNALRSEFGSLDQRITHIIYTNGELDPWLYTGMLSTHDLEAEVITIPYHSRSADRTSISTADSVVLYAAKQRIRELILNWSLS